MNKFEKIFLIGSGRVAGDCLRELQARNIDVTCLGIYKENFSSTEKLCSGLGIDYKFIGKDKIKEYLLNINQNALIISAHNAYIFPACVTEKSNLTIINLHIAFLPQYRGMNPPTWEIFNQEKYAGATWHIVNDKIDSGGIIVQEKVPIYDDDTAMKLMLRCFQAGVRMFKENLDDFISGNFNIIVPDNSESSKLYLAKDLPNDGYLSPYWDIKQSYAFLRSMDYSGANIISLPRVVIDGENFEIKSYRKILSNNNQNKAVETAWDFNADTCTLNITGGGGVLSDL